jgi:hypothetical protein
VGSNPGTVYWMDVSNDNIIENTEIRVAKWGTSKNIRKMSLKNRRAIYYSLKIMARI